MKRAIDLIWPQYREPAKCGFRLLGCPNRIIASAWYSH